MSELLNIFFQILAVIAVCIGIFVIVYFFIELDASHNEIKSDIEFSDESQEERYVYNYYNSNTILSPLNEWRKKNGI